MQNETQSFKDQLLHAISNLSAKDKALFDHMYRVWDTKGSLKAPREMHLWIQEHFGTVESVENQDFIKITNRVTFDGAIFNELRMKRPVVGDKKWSEVIEEIESAKGEGFGKPLELTPEDTFGRVKGEYCITASNIAKYDGLHGLIIFDEQNPLHFSRKRLRDYFDVAKKWFAKANEVNPSAVYPFFLWNCLWRAGSSIVHGHAQVTLTHGEPYAKIEKTRHLTMEYLEMHHRNYFDDEYEIHEKLGLAFTRETNRLLVKITPVKDKEILIITNDFGNSLADFISDVLTTMKEKLGVASFNVAVILPPLVKTVETWHHMPVIVKIVDRGKLSSRTADIGAMELYGQSVIETNPYLIFQTLKESLEGLVAR